jgi:hypothetical protein
MVYRGTEHANGTNLITGPAGHADRDQARLASAQHNPARVGMAQREGTREERLLPKLLPNSVARGEIRTNRG